ncbi:uncharacterized protein LOC134671544 [Cydia fagiglandana]|uniref:uncharacterized protein LOC134671544 n=1 Tax=Cydia fagiglandana TaxID=1458189 RepID=UPI002FEE5719
MEAGCQLLLYLDKRRLLLYMKEECENFLQKLNDKSARFPPFRYLLEIDVMDVIDLVPDVGNLLLKEPLKLQHKFNEILFACLQNVNNYTHGIECPQVAVTLRLKSVPSVLLRTNSRNFSGLVHFRGLLLAISKPASYAYHTVWSCPEECEGSEVILQYIPKVPPKCYVCKSVLFENSGLKRCGEKVTATFLLKGQMLTKQFLILDDLIPKLKLGSIYDIYGVILKKITSIWSIEEVLPFAAPVTSPIPSDIAKLYRSCNGIPWSFIYCLASSLGLNVCPLNTFMELKINLLLSLASVKANALNSSKIIHVLVANFDTRYVGEIMTHAAKLADRSVFLGTSNTTVSTALIASSGGVCVMPLPLHSYNQKQTSAILTAIESGEISTETCKTDIRSAIWAQGMDFKKIILFNVANVFGTVCRGDLGQYTDEVVDMMLQRAVEPEEISEEEIKAHKDLASYLDMVAGVKVSLDDHTERLLRNYMLAARREMPKGVSVGNMGALVLTCLTSARLCGRAVANMNDAVFAIWLHISGSPEPRIAPDEYLRPPSDVKRLTKTIDGFKNWLEQFTCSMMEIL